MIEHFRDRVQEVLHILRGTSEGDEVEVLYEELRKRQIILCDFSGLTGPSVDDTGELQDRLRFLREEQDDLQ